MQTNIGYISVQAAETYSIPASKFLPAVLIWSNVENIVAYDTNGTFPIQDINREDYWDIKWT